MRISTLLSLIVPVLPWQCTVWLNESGCPLEFDPPAGFHRGHTNTQDADGARPMYEMCLFSDNV